MTETQESDVTMTSDQGTEFALSGSFSGMLYECGPDEFPCNGRGY